MFFSRELPNTELLKKIVCLESEQLSYNMVRKNIYNETDLKLVNQTLDRIKDKYGEDKFLMFDNIRDFATSSAEVRKFKPDIIYIHTTIGGIFCCNITKNGITCAIWCRDSKIVLNHIIIIIKINSDWGAWTIVPN